MKNKKMTEYKELIPEVKADCRCRENGCGGTPHEFRREKSH